MRIRISKDLIRSILLILCVIMMEKFFYLVDWENIHILGILSYRHLWISLLIVFAAYTYIQFKLWKRKETYHFGKEIFLLACLVFVASVRGHIIFGESFLDGLQGCYLIILLSYYPMKKFYSRHIINDKVIDNGMIICGIIAFLIYFFQVQFFGSKLFLHVNTGERYESLRLYVDSIFCLMLGFYGMNSFLRTKKWKGLILVGVTVLYELFISKGRLEFVAFCVSMAIGIILMKRYTIMKTLMLAVAVGFVFIFLNTQYADSIFEAINNLNNGTGTMRVRAYGRELYATQLLSSMDSLIFGCGYPGTESAMNMCGHNDNVYLVDNGIFAFVYVHGIIGLIAVVIWFAKMFKLAWMLYKKQNEYVYLMFVIFNIVLMYNIIFWWWQYAWTLVTVIMMCKMEYCLYDTKEKIPLFQKLQ